MIKHKIKNYLYKLLNIHELINQPGHSQNRSLTSQVSDHNSFVAYLISLRAEVLQKNDIHFVDRNNEITETHYIKDFFYNNNEYLNFQQTKYLVQEDLEYKGNGYIYIEKLEGTKKLLSYFWVPAEKVSYYKGHYRFHINNKIYNAPKERVIHFKTVTTKSRFQEDVVFGTPFRLNAARQLIESEKSQKIGLKKFYDKEHTLPFFVKSENALGINMEIAKDKLNSKLPPEYQAVGILENGMSLEPITSFRQAAMQGPESLLMQLSTVFGFSLDYLYAKMNNRATAEVFEKEFYKRTEKPILENFVTTINDYLNKVLKIDDIQMTYNEPNFAKPIVTLNEMRIAEGWSEIESGDDFWVVPSGYNMVPKNEIDNNESIIENLQNEIDKKE